ncbi:MAG: hypothetical protein V9F03_13780 [Microthrixaceae bacterium]
MAKQRHLRPDDRLDDDDIVVVRGGDLDPEALRIDAERYHSIYGTYGLSVFAARDVAVDELAQQAPLIRFKVLTLVRVGVLRSGGFRLEPTGRNPRHFTVGFDDLESGISELRYCEHRSWVNPYHED